MADEPQTQTQTQPKATNKSTSDGKMKVVLLAARYDQLVNPDQVFDNPRKARYRKYVKGQTLNVTPEEFECGNTFKPSFREVTE